MKNETIAAVVAVLVIVLGIQAYTMFQLNERLNQLSGQPSSLQTQIPNLQKLNPNKPDDEFFKGRTWNPYEEMRHMQDEMEQMFGDSFSRFHMKTPLSSLSSTPDVDLQEKPDRYIVTVNAPGAEESSMDIKLENQVLRISIKTEHAKDETDNQDSQYRYRERFVGQFQRVLTLPGPANEAKMETAYRNGVLTITIPKT